MFAANSGFGGHLKKISVCNKSKTELSFWHLFIIPSVQQYCCPFAFSLFLFKEKEGEMKRERTVIKVTLLGSTMKLVIGTTLLIQSLRTEDG